MKTQYKRGDSVQVVDRDGVHPTVYTVVGYVGHGFVRIYPAGTRYAQRVDIPHSRIRLFKCAQATGWLNGNNKAKAHMAAAVSVFKK